MISERALSKMCRPAVFGRGRAIARHGESFARRRCRYGASLTSLAADVKSATRDATYQVSAEVDEMADSVESYSCSCPAAAAHAGPCKHVVALVLDFNRNMESYGGWDESEHVPTTSALADYLERASSVPVASRARNATETPGSVRLEPTLVLHRDLFLRLRIAGARGSYVVRSIVDFVADVEAGAWHEYGKKLAFVHDSDAFEPWSARLAAFVCRCVRNRRAYAAERLYGHLYASGTAPSAVGHVGKELRLSGPEIDELMELCLGRTVALERTPAEGERAEVADVVVSEGDPDVSLEIVELDGGDYELVRGARIDCFSGAARSYAVQGERLLRLSEGLARASSFLGSVYCSPTRHLLLSSGDAPRFAATVLPTLSSALPVELPPSLAALMPVACSLEFRLDHAGGNITCDVYASYGERRYRVFDRELGDSVDYARDLAAESAARALVCRYFPQPRGSFAVMSDRNTAAVARLLFEGVERMRELGTIVKTDGFERLYNRGRATVTLDVSARSGLIDLSVSSGDLPLSELNALLASYRLRRRYHRLRDGSYVDLEAIDLERASMLVDELGLTSAQLAAGHATLPPYKAFLLDSLMDDAEKDAAFDGYVERFRTVDQGAYEPPAELRELLRPYQVEGFRWLCALVDMGFGGILADEMGLGKSVQLIALLLARRGAGRTLIVCPASLVYNWQAEFEKFAPTLDVVVVAGSAEERRRIRAQDAHDVYITSYDLVRRDVHDWASMDFWCIALDEAQYIKNHETLAARAVKAIGAKHRLALTGTPVENRLCELWSIFDFLMPGLLGSYERFRDRYEQPIAEGRTELAERLAAAVGPFILRRLKAQVLGDLPEKLEQVVVARMGDEQRRLYAAHEQRLRLSISQTDDAGLRAERMQVLAELMRLRQICCDPRLVYEDYAGGAAKLDTIMDLVTSAIDSQQKVLVFSQFTSYLALVAERLDATGVSYHSITGTTPKRRRVELVDSFNGDDVPVFLVSLKAGGTGLNLVGASVVIHADPWWNAAAENQATDRAHRIGQTRAVTVYKVIARDTIEERIVALQVAKSDLAEQVIGAGGGAGSLAALRREDLVELLGGD